MLDAVAVGGCLAFLAKAHDFDRRVSDFESQTGGLFLYQCRNLRVVQFSYLLTALADQELPGVIFAYPVTAHKCVQRFDFMHETVLHQKFQRPVNGGRRGISLSVAQFLQDIVCAGWRMAAPHDLEYAASQRCEPQACDLQRSSAVDRASAIQAA